MYEKNVENSDHFLYNTYPKFYTQKFALRPDDTSELLSTKLNLNLVYTFIFFLLDFTLKIWELPKGNFCWSPWCLSKITCQLHMCKQEQPVLQSRYRSIDPSKITALSEVFVKTAQKTPHKKLWNFNSVSQKWSKALISPSQVKTKQL